MPGTRSVAVTVDSSLSAYLIPAHPPPAGRHSQPAQDHPDLALRWFEVPEAPAAPGPTRRSLSLPTPYTKRAIRAMPRGGPGAAGTADHRADESRLQRRGRKRLGDVRSGCEPPLPLV